MEVRSVQLKTSCPHCQATVRVSQALVGRNVRCPGCQQPFEVATVRSAPDATPEPLPAAALHTAEDAARETRPPAAPAATSKERTIRKLGRFELKAVLGQGAFGRVYRAYDPQLDRFVALKVPTFSLEDNRRVLRFIAEAKSAARLRHPNIVPTYESGLVDGQYYIATQFVSGMPLSRRIKEQPLEPREAADWIRQLAGALAYAHGEGIVHRDIKPDNIMLDEKWIPQLMDFGLARRTDEDSAMTTDGSILGTPAYMAPEQARGENAKVGPHSDQFSLGVVLYELLTGKRPFDGSPHAVLAQVIGVEPPPPRAIRPEIPADLEAICLKAMEKEPARRYADALAFADDLARWLAGETVRARPARLWERGWKWSKRNPMVAALSAGMLSVAILAFVGISAALGAAITSRRQAIADRNAAQTSRDKANSLANDLQRQKEELQETLANLRTETNRADAKTAEASQLDSQIQKVQAKTAAAEKRMLEAQQAEQEAQQAEQAATTKAAEAKAQADVALERVAKETQRAQRLLGKSYLDLGMRRCEDGKVAEGALWLVRSLETLPADDKEQAATIRAALAQYLTSSNVAERDLPEVRLALSHEQPVTSADFHPQEALLVSGDSTGQIHLWDTATGERLMSVPGHTKRVRYVGFAPGETVGLVTAGEDSVAIAWRITKDRKLEALTPKMQHQFPVTCVSWSENGRWILAGSDQSRRMQLWNATTRRAAGSGFGDENQGRVFSLALHPGGEGATDGAIALVGTGLLQRSVGLWDAVQGKPLAGKTPLTFSGDVRAVTFDPRGKLAVAATLDKKAWIIDIAKWQLAQPRPIELQGRPTAVAWSAVHPLIVLGCDDRTAILWDPLENTQRGDALLHGDRVTAVGFHPSGDEFLTASEDRTVRVWRLPRTQQRREIEVGKAIDALTISPDGRRVVTASGRDLAVWSTDSQKAIVEIRDKTAAVYSLAFAPDGRTLLVGDARSARLWSTRAWKAQGIEMAHADRVLGVAYSRDGQHLASASADRTARVWNAATQTAASEPLPHPDRVTSVAFSPDGLRIATGCADQQVRIWNWADAKPQQVLPAISLVHSVAFSDDGRLVVAGCDHGTAVVWNAESGEALGAPLAHSGAVRQVSFLPRSSQVLTASLGGVQTWSAATQQRLGPPVELRGQAAFVALGQEGRTVASAVEGPGGVVTVWGLPPTLHSSPEWLATWVQITTGRQLSATGGISALSADELHAARTRLLELEKKAAE